MRNKLEIKELEYEIVNGCNLNCKGCYHFSNIEKRITNNDIVQFEDDLKRLKELKINIKIMRLLGGEPLINLNMKNYIIVAKKYYPDCELFISTNGILITKLSQETINTIVRNRVILNITIYQNTIDKKSTRIFLRKNKIRYTFGKIYKNEFTKKLTENKNANCDDTFKCCTLKKCNTLSDGKIGVCPIAMSIRRCNDEYKTEYPENCCINIYEHNAEEIIDFLKRPNEMCCYCSKKVAAFKWCVVDKNTVSKNDWIINKSDKTYNDYRLLKRIIMRLYRIF